MPKRRQNARRDVFLLTGDDIVELSLEMDPGYIVSMDTIEAWEEDINQQPHYPGKNGRNFQVISELDKTPLKVFKDKPVISGQKTDVIASQKQDEELAFMNTRHEKNKMFIWAAIIAALFAVVISIVVLVQLKKSADAPITAMMIPFIGTVVTKVHWLFGRGKNKRKRKKNEYGNADDLKELSLKENKYVQCIVIVEETGEGTFPIIASDLIPTESNRRRYKGKPCHLLGLDTENKLWAIEPDTDIDKGQSPKDCAIALECENEVNAAYPFSGSFLEKLKIGFLCALCFVELIVLFLIVTVASGGRVA